jgi:4-amino-4-deoxy-L-arabinose transferase-like glycosyltransferase
MRAGWRQTWALVGLALALRLAVVAWAASRFPPAGDGFYYDRLAQRIASGAGYTWLWPDGAVTYAAHYPVGYPALLAAGYAVFGARAAVAMVLNACLGAVAAGAMHRLALHATSAWRALAAGFVVAAHPALVLYTGAVMTEGVTTALLVLAAALAAAARAANKPLAFWLGSGAVMGFATLVRPQCLLLAPILGWLAAPAEATRASRAKAAVILTVVTLACCVPWTARNCVRMHRAALVSVNGGWNLLIGTQTSTGGWTEVVVPAECRTVWDEAQKDVCFERAARAVIANAPVAWLARMPAKLAATFDYIGAAPWYLHLSNAGAFGERAKVVHGGIETVVTRLLLLAALSGAARFEGPRRRARVGVALAGAIAALTLHAWLGYAALAVATALLGARALARAPLLLPYTAALIAATAATHAAFFGAGRYGLVVLPFVGALAFAGVPAPPPADGRRATPVPPDAIESRASSASSGSSSPTSA